MAADEAERLIGQFFLQLVYETRFANSRLAADHRDLAGAALSLAPPFNQQSDLMIAPDQWRQISAPERVQAVARAAFRDDLKGWDRLRQAFEREIADAPTIESVLHQKIRRMADQN